MATKTNISKHSRNNSLKLLQGVRRLPVDVSDLVECSYQKDINLDGILNTELLNYEPLQFWTFKRLTIRTTIDGGDGLTTKYYCGTSFEPLRSTRINTTINADLGTGAVSSLVSADRTFFPWTEKFRLQSFKRYTFSPWLDNHAPFWANSQQFINNQVRYDSTKNQKQITHQPKQNDTNLEYVENTNGATSQLLEFTLSLFQETVLHSQLSTPHIAVPASVLTWDYLGFNYASWWNGSYTNPQSTQALGQLKATGADTATIVSTYYLSDTKSSTIFSTNNTESLANVETAIIDAKSKGLAIWLKPHLDLTNGEFRGNLDPSDRATFFSNYKTLLLDYAHLGQKHGAEALVLGTELNGVTTETDKAAWLDIIQAVKQVYTGKLTYAANWDAPDKIPFVSQLDMIGIDAYYPLTQTQNATVDQLVSAWTTTPEDSFVKQLTGGQSIVDWLRGIAQTTGKPIVFTEVGFRSVDGAAAAPHDSLGLGTLDLEEQSRLYEAFFKVFGGKTTQAGDVSWFDGAQLWSWYASADMNNDPSDTDYAVLGKPAEAIIKQYATQLLSDSPSPQPAPDPLTNPGALKYDFRIISDQGDSFSGDVFVTNMGNSPIDNWALQFTVPYEIDTVWNAQIMSLGNSQYQAKAIDSAPWNQVISPGETISFGFVGNAADPISPSNFVLKTA